ncbi:hypothetical protein H4R21_002889, partial [Coemansia helicoidea]
MQKFTALYTHQKLKKAKTWQDGAALYDPDARELVLLAASGERLASYRLRAKETIGVGGEYDIGRFLLTLEGEDAPGGAPPTAAAPCSAGQSAAGGGPLRTVRRVKRPASLIKPIQLKPTAHTPSAEVRPVADSPQPSASRAATGVPGGGGDVLVEYTALYTTQKTKKAKTWSDGMVVFSAGDRRLTLKDEGGATLTTTHIAGSVSVAAGCEIDSGRFLIQIEREKGDGTGAEPESSGAPPPAALRLRRQPGPLRLSKKTSSLAASDAEATAATALGPPKPPRFVPPAPQTPTHLHFPRRGELLQHVGVSKGFGLGPPRRLVAPVSCGEWTEYRDGLAALLRENLAVELAALAIRYFFMARERMEAQEARPPAKRRGRAAGSGLVQACKSVGVLLFDGCTLRQPFLDSAAFKAQRSTGAVQLAKGDSVMIELSRREAYAGYAKDDTWALSAADDFAYESTFLARSAYYGPSKNNTLELVLVGDEDARAATRILNDAAGTGAALPPAKRGARTEKAAATVYAIRCLDSASAWSMLDTAEELLSPEALPILPHLLGMAALPPAPAAETSAAAVLAKADDVMAACRQALGLSEEQYGILRQVVLSAVSIYVPVDGASAVTAIHGPFGTGKSFLIAAITACLDELARELPDVFGGPAAEAPPRDGPPRLRVMLSSMTNFAVDNMLDALLKQGYDQFLRVGSLRRVSRRILPYVLRSSASAADDVRELQSMLDLADDDAEADVITAAIQRIRQQDTQST